jgi:hypothetical protein
MKKIIFSAAVLMSFIACKDNAGNTGSSSETQPAVTQPATSTTPATPSSTTALPQGSGSSTAGLNPPHGQPGHDCSVAVGAPLKGGAGGAATTQPMIQPTTAAPAISLPANNTTGNTSGAKLNPPHGQPGHDCSVEVGKPLKQ